VRNAHKWPPLKVNGKNIFVGRWFLQTSKEDGGKMAIHDSKEKSRAQWHRLVSKESVYYREFPSFPVANIGAMNVKNTYGRSGMFLTSRFTVREKK
jgi:hypothetical protein